MVMPLYLLLLYAFIYLLLLLLNLLFRREVLRQQLYDFFIIALLGDIERRCVGIRTSITITPNCTIASEINEELRCGNVIRESSYSHRRMSNSISRIHIRRWIAGQDIREKFNSVNVLALYTYLWDPM